MLPTKGCIVIVVVCFQHETRCSFSFAIELLMLLVHALMRTPGLLSMFAVARVLCWTHAVSQQCRAARQTPRLGQIVQKQLLRRSHGPSEFFMLDHRQLQASSLTSSSRLVKSSSRDKFNSNSMQGPRAPRPKRMHQAKRRRLSSLPRRRLHALPRRMLPVLPTRWLSAVQQGVLRRHRNPNGSGLGKTASQRRVQVGGLPRRRLLTPAYRRQAMLHPR